MTQDASSPDRANNSERNANSRRRLGRGLNALLGESMHGEGEHPGADLREVDVADISPNPYQPRTEFDPTAHEELVNSVRQHGVLQPILVRPFGSGFQLIAGERRWRASQAAGLERVPCRILELDERGMSEVALEENLKRRDLSILEKAQAFQEYLNRFETSIEDLARQVSMDRSTVSNILRLLELPDEVKDALKAGKISGGHARTLLSLNQEQQIEVCRRIQAQSLSVRKTEAAVRAILKPQEATPTPNNESGGDAGPATIQISNHVQSLADQLRDRLGAKVEIRLRGKDSGTIVIHFSSNEDFERVVGELRRAA